MVRKTREEALATRTDLLNAAELAFSANGVAHTSLADIASKAGVTRGAVYWHFQNKSDLIAALWERVALPMQQALDALRSEYAHDALTLIREKSRWVLQRIEHDDSTRNLMMILLLRCEFVEELETARTFMLGQRENCFGQLTEEFRQAITQGRLPASCDAESCAIALMSAMDGLCLHWLIDPKRFNLQTVGATLVDAYLAGLIAKP